MAAIKYEFSIGALKAFYSIFCADILLVCILRNAVSENRKKSAPKVSSKSPFNNLVNFHGHIASPSGKHTNLYNFPFH